MMDRISVFAPKASHHFASRIADTLQLNLDPLEERDFEDGEHKIRPLCSVRGKDVFVIQSLYSDAHESVNDKLCRLLFLLGALRDAAVTRLTAVIPYLAYARKDRRSQPRDPVTSRYVAQLLESTGIDGVLTVDVHNLAAFQNAFRCRADHLEAAPLFVQWLLPKLQTTEKIVVVSPDAGGVKRAEAMRQRLERALNRQIEMAFFEKARAKGVLRTGRMIGDVQDAEVIIIDDLISTGRTMSHAAKLCKEVGAARVYAAATHGVFTSTANDPLKGEEFDRILITDTIPPFRLDSQLVSEKFDILPVSRMFAEAIRRIHFNESIIEMLSTP
jgi:ribose-phosphate pyrophosphokinase